MPIPPTAGRYATMPVGRHTATLDEVYTAFVETAPFRERRELIFRALTLFIELVEPRFSSARYWIDGGFVTHKPWEEPEDADVVVVVPPAEHGRAAAFEWNPPLKTVHLNQTDKLHPMGGLLDAFFEPDEPGVLGLWDLTWSAVRDEHRNIVPGEMKGYLEVTP